MQRRILQIVSFLIFIIFLDAFVGASLKRLYSLQEIGAAGQLNNTFFKTTADIVILGNSRAQHNYNDKTISKSTGMITCNAGQDGGYGIWLPYASVDAMFRRYTPKIIVVEFNPASVGYWKGTYERLNILLPYIDQFEVCKNLVSQRSKLEKLKWFSSIYPYNSHLYTLVIGKLFENRLKHVKGFMPIGNKNINALTDTADIFNHYSDTADSFNIEALERLLKICKEKKVKLIFVNSPVFAGKSVRLLNQTMAAKEALKKIHEAEFPFWDYTTDKTIVFNQSFFADQVHLNKAGANYFTTLIAERLSNIVKTD